MNKVGVIIDIVGRIAGYTTLAADITLPGFLVAIAVVLFQVDLPSDASHRQSPLDVLLKWSSRDGPIAERLEDLEAERLQADAALIGAQTAIVEAARAKGHAEQILTNVKTDSPPLPAAEAAGEFRAAKATFDNATVRADNFQKVWDSIATEIAAVRARRSQSLQSLADTLIGNVVALGVLTWIIREDRHSTSGTA